jgi:sugar phosphate isomerase/epimerase
MLQGDELPRTIAYNLALGNKFLIVSWADCKTKEGWVELAQALNEAAGKLRPHGLFTGYHNHAQEFKAIEGELPWDIIGANTGPEVVMQLDFGHCLHAGADPAAALRKYIDRSQTVHVKEWCAANDVPIVGEGDVNWEEMFGIMESADSTEWYIVEQEVYPCPPMEAAERCIKNLKRMGK